MVVNERNSTDISFQSCGQKKLAKVQDQEIQLCNNALFSEN